MLGAREAGHVAIVTAVGPDWIEVRESNWACALVPDTRRVTPIAGLRFIHPLPTGGPKPVDPMDISRGSCSPSTTSSVPARSRTRRTWTTGRRRMVKEGVEAVIQTMRATPEYSAQAAREAAEAAAGGA